MSGRRRYEIKMGRNDRGNEGGEMKGVRGGGRNKKEKRSKTWESSESYRLFTKCKGLGPL